MWYSLGSVYSTSRYDLFDYLNQWLPRADACFDAGVEYAPMDEHILFNVAWYWVWRAGLLPERKEEIGKRVKTQKTEVGEQRSEISSFRPSINNQQSKILFREDGIRKFQEYFQRALALAPRNWKKAVERTWAYFPDDAVVMGIVPKNDHALKTRLLRFLGKT